MAVLKFNPNEKDKEPEQKKVAAPKSKPSPLKKKTSKKTTKKSSKRDVN
jgi:hypothetical protein